MLLVSRPIARGPVYSGHSRMCRRRRTKRNEAAEFMIRVLECVSREERLRVSQRDCRDGLGERSPGERRIGIEEQKHRTQKLEDRRGVRPRRCRSRWQERHGRTRRSRRSCARMARIERSIRVWASRSRKEGKQF